MKNKPNFFFDNRGFPNWGGGGSAAWEFFPHNPVFFSDNDPNTMIQQNRHNNLFITTTQPDVYLWRSFGGDEPQQSTGWARRDHHGCDGEDHIAGNCDDHVVVMMTLYCASSKSANFEPQR